MDDSLEILNGKKLADNSNYVSATFRYVFSQIFRDFHRFAGTFRDFQRFLEIFSNFQKSKIFRDFQRFSVIFRDFQ